MATTKKSSNSVAWYMAIDQGGHATRALVYDNQGHLIEQAKMEVSVYHPHEDWVEQKSTALLDSVRAVIEQIAYKLGKYTRQIVAAGLATQRSNIVCWDRDSGRPLSPAISWQDRRANSWLKSLSVNHADIHKFTGLLLSPHYGASKLRWCLDNLPAVRQANQKHNLAWGPLASFLTCRITHEHHNYVDPANAARTLLWNLQTMDWSSELLGLFGLPAGPLPTCVPTIYNYGHLTINKCRLPLNVVTGDQSAAIYAYGVPDPKNVYINIGTGAFIQRSTQNQVISIPGILSGIVCSDSKQSNYVLESTVNGAGCALSEIENQLNMSTEYAERKFDLWLSEIQDPPLFLNGIAGLGAPYWIADFKSKFIGNGQDNAKIVAVAESILFLIKVNLEKLSGLSNPISKIVATGGLSTSNGLCQRLADLCGISIYRPSECEATACGTAFLSAGMPYGWQQDNVGRMFYPQHNPAFIERYHQWQLGMSDAISRYSSNWVNSSE